MRLAGPGFANQSDHSLSKIDTAARPPSMLHRAYSTRGYACGWLDAAPCLAHDLQVVPPGLLHRVEPSPNYGGFAQIWVIPKIGLVVVSASRNGQAQVQAIPITCAAIRVSNSHVFDEGIYSTPSHGSATLHCHQIRTICVLQVFGHLPQRDLRPTDPQAVARRFTQATSGFFGCKGSPPYTTNQWFLP